MTVLSRAIIAAAFAAVVGMGIYEARQAASWRTKAETLQAQQEQKKFQSQKESDATASRPAANTPQNAAADSNLAELLKLRSEVGQLREQLAGASSRPQRAVLSPQALLAANQSAPGPGSAGTATPINPALASMGTDYGSLLGSNIVNGDAKALDKLMELARAESQSYLAARTNLDQNDWGPLTLKTFAPLRAAFAVIDSAAAQGNQNAVEAIARSISLPGLQGFGTESMGKLAGSGNSVALDVLTAPDKYGILLSSSVGALKPAANSGNQTAIDFLAGVTKDDRDQPLWFMAADDLSKAAESGNPTAIDALAGLLSKTNASVQRVALGALRRAAANQNPRAAEALHAAGLF